MKHLLLSITCLFTICIKAQTFAVGHMSINFKDAARTGGYSISGGIAMTGTGRDIGTEIYYPAVTAGNNTAVASGQFPVVVFGHGFVMAWDSYDNIYTQLAANGYIVLLPRTEGSFSPAHAEFGADLKFLANAGMALNSISTPSALAGFNGKVAQKSAIGGHSMGAGSSYLAAASNTSITCFFNFAAATTNPSSITSSSLITVPALVISGARDCVADTTVQNSHYAGLTSAKKFHIILKQLTHCDFGNGTNTNCTLGQGTTGCGNQVSNALAFPRYMNYLRNFLDNQLKNDCAAGQRFMDSVNTGSSLRSGLKKQGTLVCTTTSINQLIADPVFSIFPNPAQNKLNITYQAEANQQTSFELYDVTGKLLYKTTENLSQPTPMTKEINIEKLSPGTYVLLIQQQGFKKAFKVIKN